MSKEKRDRFVRLAIKRVNRAIKDIRLVGNLSNRAAYAFSDEDSKKIVRALQKEVDSVKARFSGPSGGAENEFEL